MRSRIRRGDIYYVDLPKGIGSEQFGARPVLIIQNDIGNMFSPTTIVAAITSFKPSKHTLPTHVMLEDECGLSGLSIVLLEQIFTVDKQRLEQYIGSVKDDEMMSRINRALGYSIDLID